MKKMCPPGYRHHNDIVATHALGHMMHGYTLLVHMNQSVLNKLSKEHNISGHKWSTTRRVLKSHRSKMRVMYMQSWKQCVLPAITTMALWQLMHLGTWCTVYTLLVHMNQSVLNKLSKEHNISGHKWSATHRVLKSHRSKMRVIYMQSWKQCALLAITTMGLWQLMH